MGYARKALARAALLCAALLLLLPAGCGSGPGEEAMVVGIVLTAAEDSWKERLQESVIREITGTGAEVMTISSERTQSAQISALRSLIVYRTDLILFSPVISTGWENILGEARSAGIPVLTFDKAVDSGRREPETSHVGYDYHQAAGDAARQLLTLLREGDVLVELGGTTGSTQAQGITRGFRDVLLEDGRWQIGYSVSGDYLRSRGEETVRMLLENRMRVDCIISHNDAMTLGAIDALEAHGLGAGRDVLLFSAGGGAEVVDLMREGRINCLIHADPDALAAQVAAAVAALAEAPQTPVQTLLPVTLHTEEDLL